MLKPISSGPSLRGDDALDIAFGMSRCREHRRRLGIVFDRSLVLDPLEDFFPMDRDVLRGIHPKTNLGPIHAKDSHYDVRTDANGFAASPREYQHGSLRACLERYNYSGAIRRYTMSRVRDSVVQLVVGWDPERIAARSPRTTDRLHLD
jgi:hypothetical protein